MSYGVKEKIGLSEKQLTILQSEMEKRSKKHLIAWLLWAFLSIFGGHKFYLGEKITGVLMLVLSFLTVGSLMGVSIALQSMTIGGTYEHEIMGFVPIYFIAVMVFYLALIIWVFIDAFKMNGRINKYNEVIEKEIIDELKAEEKINNEEGVI